jgi:dihydrofolate reductase
MKQNSGKSILNAAITLDGYLAGEGEDLSFLSVVESKDEDYGFKEFMKSIDVSIMGRRTFDWVMKHEPSYVSTMNRTYVITHHELPSNARTNSDNIVQFEGDVCRLVRNLLEQGKNLFIVGGGEIILQLLQENLIDEFHIAIVPILIGKGILLFKPGFPQTGLRLLDVKKYNTGLVMLKYAKEQNMNNLVDARENN